MKGATNTGKGSRSSKNHCAGGASDEEISCLSPEMKQRVGMKDQKKDIWDDTEHKQLVSYVLDPIQWPEFKINQMQIFGEVSIHVCMD